MDDSKINRLLSSYGESSVEDLTKSKTIRETVNTGIFSELEKISLACLRSEDRVQRAAKSYETVLHIYKNSKIPGLAIEKEPNQELKKFWSEISLVSGRTFNNMELFALSTDRGSPGVFFGFLIHFAYETGKDVFAKQYLEPLFAKAKQLG